MNVPQKSARKGRWMIAAAVVVIAAGWIGSELRGGDQPSRVTSVPTQESEDASSFAGGFGSVSCDKVTTYVCPDGTCLCEQQNCSGPWHNGDVAPCNGPPAPGCEHNFGVQFCFPVGQPISCNEGSVPVGACAIGCRDGGVTYTMEGACCRGERKCLPKIRRAEPVPTSNGPLL